MGSNDLEDSMTRSASQAEELHVQILAQIRDNMTLQGKMLAEQGKILNDMNCRLIRVEERDERIRELQDGYKSLDGKVDVLFRDKDQRAGAQSFMLGIRGWTPVIIAFLSALASIFAGLYLAGRATGIVNAPPSHVSERTVGEVQSSNVSGAKP